MPQTLGLLLFQVGLGGLGTAVAQFGATALGAALFNVGISLGLSYLASAFAQRPSQKPEDVQQSTRQPAQTRSKHYGRVKISGPWMFGESYQGNFYKVLALGVGPFDAIEQFWVDDAQVTVAGDGTVSGGKLDFSDPAKESAKIYYRLGAATETSYSQLTDVFPEWTTSHRGDGIASILAIQRAVEQDEYLDAYPNGINTNYRVVARASKLTPFGGGTPAWGDNAAAVIYDYMRSRDGQRLPTAVLDTPQALAGWSAAYARATENVALKAGGTDDRYRIWGSYQLSERPADVLNRMLAACDGRLVPTPDGGLTLDIGTWAEPDVIIDEGAIVGFSGVKRGRNILETANTIRATYLDPSQDYQSTDADPWVDEADVTARGEIALDTSFIMAPSHSQARRLMKLTAYRAKPRWTGTFQTNLRGLAAYGKRFIRLRYAAFAIDEVMEVQDLKLIIGEGATVTGVTLELQSMPAEAYAWDATQEEGDAPVAGSVDVDDSIPSPTDGGRTFDVTIIRKTIGGQLVPYGLLAFDASPSSALVIEARGKRTADSAWNPIGVSDNATSAESFALSDGEEYEFQIRYVTLAKKAGPWTDSVVITAIADTTPPDPVTNVTKAGGTGSVALGFKAPASANYAATNIYRGTVNSFGSASLVGTVYGAPNTSYTTTDAGLAAGTYYYWLVSRNASGVEGTEVATGSVTVS